MGEACGEPLWKGPLLITIHDIARGLEAKRTNTGWVARCPAHQDLTPSFTLREQNGKILVRCHAGCTQDEVLAALRSRGLWPETARNGEPRTPPDPDRAEDLIRAAYWARSVLVLAEWQLEDLPLVDPARLPLTKLVRTIGLGDESVLAEYRSWRMKDPELTAGLVYAGRMSDARLQRALAQWIREGCHGEFPQNPDHR